MNQKCILLILLLLFSKTMYCQDLGEENKSKIAGILERYFDLEREAIHLHLDKTSFITNESIWYQGYIINRKSNQPYFTTNVFVVLYDDKGNQLSEKLIYASNGVFSGNITLSPKYHTGQYYIQTYTNWMNNFSEDESTITKINIINPAEGIKDYSKVNSETLQIAIQPEGGSYVSDIPNTVGIHVSDCRGNSPQNLQASIVDEKGGVLKSIKLNAFGYGKFEIIPSDEPLKVIVNYNDKTIEKQLPQKESIGIAIEVNDFTLDGKTIVKIKTNVATQKVIATKKLYLLVHQDQKYTIYDIDLSKELDQTIAINTSSLFEGVNCIRIIDSDTKQWAERLIYKYPKMDTPINSILKSKNEGDKMTLVGYSTFKNASLSISVLPANSLSYDSNSTIFSGLTIDPYLIEPLTNANYYFTNLGRIKYYELDMALLNQEKTKYDWEFMKTTTPNSIYSFDIGLDLKGIIDNKVMNKTYHKVKLKALKEMLLLSSDITEKGEYNFNHILLGDSTYVSLSLEKLPDFEEIPNVFSPQVLNRKKPFYKPFRLRLTPNCLEIQNEEFNSDFDFPKIASNAISLKEIKVKIEKNKLNYENKLGNGNLRGFKIDETLKRQSLLNFIEQNGFRVVRDMGTATIYTRGISSLKSAQATPLISIDERTILDQSEISYMSMDEIDEIYLNPYAIVPSFNNNQGMIKIYTKKVPDGKYIPKKDPNSFYIKDAYARYIPFKNIEYENTKSQGFENYGLIGWVPRKKTDNDGQFIFQISDYDKAQGKVILEGMTNEGQLFYEEKIIELH